MGYCDSLRKSAIKTSLAVFYL